MGNFTQKVLLVVRDIPRGNTMTYQQVAAKAGNPKAARAVGVILSRNQDILIPCHRVIRTNGSFGSYNGLRGSSKESLLKTERIQDFI